MNRDWKEYLVKNGCALGKRYFFEFGQGSIICKPEEFQGFYHQYVSERPNDSSFHIMNLQEGEDIGKSYMD